MDKFPNPELYYDAVRELVWHANLTEPELGLSFERLDLICYDAEHESFTVLFKDEHGETDIWWIDLWRVKNGCRGLF